jgi:ribonuclease HII
VPRRRLPARPDRARAPRVVDGDEKSAAIAAASIVAKVTRDRLMRRMDALYPHYGFSSHVGYITPGHSAIVRERGPSGFTAARSRRSVTERGRARGNVRLTPYSRGRAAAARRLRQDAFGRYAEGAARFFGTPQYIVGQTSS